MEPLNAGIERVGQLQKLLSHARPPADYKQRGDDQDASRQEQAAKAVGVFWSLADSVPELRNALADQLKRCRLSEHNLGLFGLQTPAERYRPDDLGDRARTAGHSEGKDGSR